MIQRVITQQNVNAELYPSEFFHCYASSPRPLPFLEMKQTGFDIASVAFTDIIIISSWQDFADVLVKVARYSTIERIKYSSAGFAVFFSLFPAFGHAQTY